MRLNKFRLHEGMICLLILVGIAFSLLQPSGGQALAPERQSALTAEAVRAYEIFPAALVSLTFDDNSQSVYDTAFPILNDRGIPGTFYFISSAMTDPWRSQLQALENHGWEIGSHSQTHRDLTSLSESELIDEVVQSRADLEAAGLNISGFAYPEGSGSKDPDVVRLVKQTYDYGRATSPGYNRPIVHQYTLRIQSQVATTSLETMKSWVDEAIASRQWLIILMHTVDDSGDLYSITPQDLTDLAAYIRQKMDAGSVQVVTVRAGLAQQTETGWQPIEQPQEFNGENLALTNGKILWHFGYDQVNDYLFDGYEWVEGGQIKYWEWHGDYHYAGALTAFHLNKLDPGRSSVQFTLTDSVNGDFSVISTVSLGRGRQLAEVQTTEIQGAPEALMLGKSLTRRFSTLAGALLTDGEFEHGLRSYGESAQQISAFEQQSDLIRVISQAPTKFYTEYADFLRGEFRIRVITRAEDLPYTWCVGGLTFDTHRLRVEAEDGSHSGVPTYYIGEDASPGIEMTGILLSTSGDSITLAFTPPQPGNYMLSIRQKGVTPGAAFSLQLDERAAQIQPATDETFGYTSVALTDLSAEQHSLSLTGLAGTVILDYALLVPTSRSINTPLGVLFPADLYCQACTFLPLTFSVQQ
ncbi:MAG: polysaccharide deacetylase family protein [Anaerolineales bacterium]